MNLLIRLHHQSCCGGTTSLESHPIWDLEGHKKANPKPFNAGIRSDGRAVDAKEVQTNRPICHEGCWGRPRQESMYMIREREARQILAFQPLNQWGIPNVCCLILAWPSWYVDCM